VPVRWIAGLWVKKEAQLRVILVGYHAPNHRAPESYALDLPSTVLSGGRASRLYRRLVYEAPLALDAGGDYPRLSLDPDLFTFYATVQPEKTVDEVEREILGEVERLRMEPVAEKEELQRAKNQIEAAFVFRQDSTCERAAALGRYELVRRWRLRDDYLPKILAVTPAEVQEAARRYFVGEHQTTAILVPLAPDSSLPAR
jgi:zinc protease